MAKRRRSAIEEFLALSPEEKERVWQEIDQMTPEEWLAKSRPLTKEERARWERARSKIGMSKPERKSTRK
jgi:hypothetical protein